MAILAVLIALQAKADPYAIPFEKLPKADVKRVRAVMDHTDLTVDLDETEVASSLEVYDFCLAELTFTGQMVRVLGKGEYDIFRESDVTRKRPLTERMKRSFILDNHKGMTVKIVPVFREEGRWIFYTYGKYDMDLFSVRSRAVIVVTAKEEDGTLTTQARIFMRFDEGLGSIAADLFEGSVRKIIRDESTLFIDAAKTVTEAARREPARLSRLAALDDSVDPEVLKRFMKKFLNH